LEIWCCVCKGFADDLVGKGLGFSGFLENKWSSFYRIKNFYKLITERLDKDLHVIHPSGLIIAGHLQSEEGGDPSR
jgi:hypothetical protein